MSTKICACCGQSFQPDTRVKNRTYCSADWNWGETGLVMKGQVLKQNVKTPPGLGPSGVVQKQRETLCRGYGGAGGI